MDRVKQHEVNELTNKEVPQTAKDIKSDIGTSYEQGSQEIKNAFENGDTENKQGRRVEKIDGTNVYYDDNGNVYRKNDELSPNNQYEINGYTFDTDSKGRVCKAEGQLRVESEENREEIKGTTTIEKIAKGEQKSDDDRGHLIAKMFGGFGDLGNLVAQNHDLNHDGYYKTEKELAKAVKDGHEVHYKVEVNYSDKSFRPDGFKVTYTIDGEKFEKNFRNESGGQ